MILNKCNRINCKIVLCFVGAIIVIQVFIFNIAILFAYQKLKSIITEISESHGDTIIEKLSYSKTAGNFMNNIKHGGLGSLIDDLADRIYIENIGTLLNGKTRSSISILGIDVSNAGEVLFIYKRILSQPHFKYEKLVVDIGANDGLVSSNSYNFIRWGWDAILVEPLKDQLQLAKLNLKKHTTRWGGKVEFVNAVISEKDGEENIVVAGVGDTETHIHDLKKEPLRDDHTILTVDSMTVRTLCKTYNIPKLFGVLSIDAEGNGDLILHDWIRLGYRPAYIIYESLHNNEPATVTMKYLFAHSYNYIIKLGFNFIFEHQPEES